MDQCKTKKTTQKSQTGIQLSQLERQMEHMESRLEKSNELISKQIEDLNQFKWKLIGVAFGISILVSFIDEITRVFVR